MCGRYVLALPYRQVENLLRENGMPIRDASDMTAEDPGLDDGEFQPTYNFAPGYKGIVCRVDTASEDANYSASFAGPQSSQGITKNTTRQGSVCGPTPSVPPLYRLQVMKWGLVPSWAKLRPDYSTVPKTINCRAESLSAGSGMWVTMRGQNRCVVVAQGFYEWLKIGNKERVPYYIQRRDRLPMLFAGLWDCAALKNGSNKGVKNKSYSYAYTIITTSSNKQLQFLHDRMPVIFGLGSPELHMWLDPNRSVWSAELQSLLHSWPDPSNADDAPDFDVDVVSQEVNKAGRSSPSFIVPVASNTNKSNIANFFNPEKGRQAPTLINMIEHDTTSPDYCPTASSKREARGNDDSIGEPLQTSRTASPARKRLKIKDASLSLQKHRSQTVSNKQKESQKITAFFAARDLSG